MDSLTHSLTPLPLNKMKKNLSVEDKLIYFFLGDFLFGGPSVWSVYKQTKNLGMERGSGDQIIYCVLCMWICGTGTEVVKGLRPGQASGMGLRCVALRCAERRMEMEYW